MRKERPATEVLGRRGLERVWQWVKTGGCWSESIYHGLPDVAKLYQDLDLQVFTHFGPGAPGPFWRESEQN